MNENKNIIAQLVTATMDMNGQYYTITALGKVPLVKIITDVMMSRGTILPLGLAKDNNNGIEKLVTSIYITMPGDSNAARYFIPPEKNKKE